MKRSEAREVAFMLVFERAFRESTLEEIIKSAVVGREAQVNEFARDLAGKVYDNLMVIDSNIEKHLKDWKIGRLPKVTLAILRLAVGEIDYIDNVPVSVTINEAVEIAKKYGAEDDASYINGVLGSYAKEKAE